jgi:acyl carrier protein
MGSADHDRNTIQARVIRIVAEALNVEAADVRPHSSLQDDLGAESIDFLDILFRIETAFGIKIPEDEMWKGSIGSTDSASMAEAVRQLRERMPEFRWDRLPAHLTREDLPRLITIQTIVDYLERRAPELGSVERASGQ